MSRPPHRPPTIHGTRILAETRLFRIEAVDLRFSNGAERQYQRLISPQDAVVIVALTGAGEVLLIREYSVGTERYELVCPKGRIDSGEQGREAAARELMEEVGQQPARLTWLADLQVAPGYIRHNTQLWLAEGLTPRRLPGDEPESLSVVAWPLDDLAGLLSRQDFTEARSIAALFLVREHLLQRATP